MSKPSLPQGTRDFDASVMRKRNYIIGAIKSTFETYGYEPLETPAFEYLETLMGKYGEEGDKLIFKILNNGLSDEKNKGKATVGFQQVLSGKNSKDLTERALRYDLTIPFARYVAMNHNQLTLPFKRYQIQPVWRADRPQRGRYREFYQCDADVVGSTSLLNEVELANIYAAVFTKLGVEVTIKINNRKILAGLAQFVGGEHLLTDITVAIDKLDKVGLDKVVEELQQKGITESQISAIKSYLQLEGCNTAKLETLQQLLGSNELVQKGIEELLYILQHPGANGYPNITVDFTLARGLNYYTGTIFEIQANGVKMGSIGGGGRYDDLTGLFGVKGIAGVGISFGLDRIFDVMEELKLFPETVHAGTKVLFFNLGKTECGAAFKLMQQLRAGGTACEIFHETIKFDKQFKYAEKKQIPYAVMLGSRELESETVAVKNLKNGEQQIITWQDLLVFPFA